MIFVLHNSLGLNSSEEERAVTKRIEKMESVLNKNIIGQDE